MLLVNQLLVTTISYCNWLIDSELIELCSSNDSEQEGETDKKEKINKQRVNLFFPNLEDLNSIVKFPHLDDFSFIHHPEIITPPPKFFSSKIVLGFSIA